MAVTTQLEMLFSDNTRLNRSVPFEIFAKTTLVKLDFGRFLDCNSRLFLWKPFGLERQTI